MVLKGYATFPRLSDKSAAAVCAAGLRTPNLAISLDDFGLRSYTHEEAMTLLDLLEARYRKGILIVTSQVDSKGWFKLFEDPPTAEAIIDRLTKPSHRVVLASESYRNRLGTLRKELASKKPGK